MWSIPHVIFAKEEIEAQIHFEAESQGGPSSISNTKGKSVLTLLPMAAPRGKNRMDREGTPITWHPRGLAQSKCQ